MKTQNFTAQFQDLKNGKNFNFTSLISLALILLFLLSEKPNIFTRLSEIEVQDSSYYVKKLLICTFVILIWLAALAAIYFFTQSRPLFKWSAFIVITLSTFIVDVFFAVSNGSLLYGDYLGLRLAVGNINNALDEYGHFLLYPLFRTFLLFIAFIITSPGSTTMAGLKATVLLIFCLIIFVGICIKKDTAIRKMPGFLSIPGFEIAMLFDKNKHNYNYDHILINPESKPRRENIVLIIDESVRYDFINGEESNSGLTIKSNPIWRVYDYGSATSGNNCSSYSNIILRKGAKPEHLGAEIQENPLIWAYAKKAGFKTTLIDAQNNGHGHDYFDPTELKMIDNNVETSGFESDRDIAIELKKLLKNGNNFVIIIKMGAHFPYDHRYPKTFQPNFKSAYINDKQNRIEYARAIMYQTGNFFTELLSETLSPSTLMIYTSDHGQNLNDVSGLTHCTASSDPYHGEGLVPMLIIDNKSDENLAATSKINHNKTSHFNIFSTLLYHLGYEKKAYQSHYGNSLLEPVDRLGYFGYGSPFGYFDSKPMFRHTRETMDYANAKK